jgi:hypothetical protein
MFAHLKGSLTAVRFLWDFRSDGIFHVIRHVIVRAMPTRKEVMILHGLAKQLAYVAKRWGVTHPRDGRPPRPTDSRCEPGNSGRASGGVQPLVEGGERDDQPEG